ncbi:high-potential iron-sulfur protein [Paraburkholderia dipogonis]|uniref:high-potential iron-sulfur protein n=1 Tax=Paraburkholderia dipogonis TaxID=1211383 RepID=UPI0038BA7DBA
MKSSRRIFILMAAGFASSLGLSRGALAETVPVSESDATAQALGYNTDATKVDKAKYSRYQAGQACANCQFFQGKADDAAGPCQIYGGKQVNAIGWCSAYTKKA